MAQGLDYAFAPPDVACVARSGYAFVARYVGDPDPNSTKYLDAPELTAIRSAGLSVVAVRETSAGFMLTESGATHARVSRTHCNALGLHGIPIYYALDVDPRPLTQAQRNAVTRFLQDAAAADGGGHNVGLYGSDDAVDWWVGTDYCHWGWQTYAWSGGRISPKAHFRQYLNGQALCGGTVDLNETYRSDFGQWPRPNTPTPTFGSTGGDDSMSMTTKADGRIDVCIIGAANKVYHYYAPNPAALTDAQPEDLGGGAKAVSCGWSGETFVVVIHGLDNKLWTKHFVAGQGWSDWYRAPWDGELIDNPYGSSEPTSGPLPAEFHATITGEATITPIG